MLPFLPNPLIDRVNRYVLYRNIVPVDFEMILDMSVCNRKRRRSKHPWREDIPVVLYRITKRRRRGNLVFTRIDSQLREKHQLLAFGLAPCHLADSSDHFSLTASAFLVGNIDR